MIGLLDNFCASLLQNSLIDVLETFGGAAPEASLDHNITIVLSYRFLQRA